MSCHATSASVCAGLLAVSEQRRQRAVLAGLSLGILTCFGGLLLCPHRAECFGALTQLDARVAAGIGIGLPLAIASVFAWMGRIVWVLTRASVRTRALPISGHMPDALRVAMARTGVNCVTCLAADSPAAFCAGAFRPRLFVSDGLVRRLGPDELDVVLLHEREHARRYEPLVRAALDSAAQVLFYVPLIRWFSRHHVEDSELHADRAALERKGPHPVAAALWALGDIAAAQGSAAFGGVAGLRVAQVLGDPLPARTPGLSLVAISGMGVYFALQAASCLGQAGQHLV